MSERLVRRWASGTTHIADVPDDLVGDATIFGSSCELIQEPVATLCRVVLRAKPTGMVGDCIVVMQEDQLTCRACSRLSGQPTRAVATGR